MNALVTGGAGFIGSNLVDRLISDGHKVTVIDNESADSNEQFYWNPQARNYKYDVRDYVMIRRLYEGQDAVFHLAADARIQPSIEDPLKAFENNMIGTATVLECARVCGVKRVVYSSTSAAYGLANTPPLSETMPTDCLNPYSVSKVAGEEMCRMYAKLYGMETICFRYFNVYGERQPLRGQYAPVIGIFLRQKAAGEPMTIVGDGTQRRDFTYVGDVVEANIKAATLVAPQYVVENEIVHRAWEWGQVYNIGTGRNYSINEIAALMEGETVNIPPRPAESKLSLANANKAKQHLGWTPKVRLEDWIAEHK
jgi:UDP-glucose 4-epimerase